VQALPLQRGGGDVAGAACLPCPTAAQTVVAVVTTAGNLLLYITPSVPGLAPPLPPAPEPAAGDAAAAAEAAAAAAAAPFDEPERSELANDKARVSGDTSHIPGGSPAVTRLLLDRSDPEAYFEAAAPGAVRLVLRLPSDAGLAFVGARLLLGASGAAFAPTQALVGEGPAARVARLAPREPGAGTARRWYPLMLTPAEGLAPELVLHIGPAREPGLRVRIHQIDVYAQPRAAVARRAADAAAAACAALGAGAGPAGPAAELALAAASEPCARAAATAGAGACEEQVALLLRCGAAALAALPPPEAAAAAAAHGAAAQGAAWPVLCPQPAGAAGFLPGADLERDAWGLLEALAAARSSGAGSGLGPKAAAEAWRDAARLSAAGALLSSLARQAPAGRAARWEDAQAFAYLHALALAGSVTMHGSAAAMRAHVAACTQRGGAPAPAGPLGTPHDGGMGADAARCLPHVLAWLRAGGRSPFLPQQLLRPAARALLQLLATEALAAGADAPELAAAAAAAAPAAGLAASLLLSDDRELQAAAAAALPDVADAWPGAGGFWAALAAAVAARRGLAGPRMLPAYGSVAEMAAALADADPEGHAEVRWVREGGAHHMRRAMHLPCNRKVLHTRSNPTPPFLLPSRRPGRGACGGRPLRGACPVAGWRGARGP
jgi:hypothetical protein